MQGMDGGSVTVEMNLPAGQGRRENVLSASGRKTTNPSVYVGPGTGLSASSKLVHFGMLGLEADSAAGSMSNDHQGTVARLDEPNGAYRQ